MKKHGWEQFSLTVRHQLIHAWQYHEFGEADHDRTFTRRMDMLDTSRYCTTSVHSCGGSFARTVVVGLHTIDARKRFATQSNTAVVSAVGRSVSRTATDIDSLVYVVLATRRRYEEDSHRLLLSA
jgi:hypothetical protein